MPSGIPETYIVEPFVQCDPIYIEHPDDPAELDERTSDGESGTQLSAERAEGQVPLEARGPRVPVLRRENVTGFVEVSIGVYGIAGDMQAMTPTLTLKKGGLLTLEEKYGTGVGSLLTPPPPQIVQAEVVEVRTVSSRASFEPAWSTIARLYDGLYTVPMCCS
jgi:hypothetical protein